MDQAILTKSLPHQTNRTNRTNQTNQYINNHISSNNPRCTCEIGKLKALGEKRLQDSICDVCSERLICNR